MPRTPRGVDLTFSLGEPASTASPPLASRIAEAIVTALARGGLRPGDALPSTRALAARLGVSRGPVVAAYDELTAAGYLHARPGSGTVVAPGADLAAHAGAATHVAPEQCPEHRPRRPSNASAVIADLRPGRPDTALIDPVAWRRAWRRAGVPTPGNDADHAPAHDDLRVALAAHLRRTRGIVADGSDLLLAPGVAALLHPLIAAVGEVPWALEDPGYAEAWSALDLAGRRSHAVPVDDEGFDPDRVPAEVRAVYVTPAHQYPLGARMPVARRAALLAWAQRSDGLIVEDDYDGEFRYDVPPMPALRSLREAADRVIYVGTASKLWTPTLRVAWVLAPPNLRGRLDLELERRGLHVPESTGHALAHLLTTGAWTTHHARCARTYAARRAALVDALRAHLPGAELCGIDAGLHLVLRLPQDCDDLAVSTRLEAAGVLANPLTAYANGQATAGLVLCYATLPETRAGTVAATIARVLGSG